MSLKLLYVGDNLETIVCGCKTVKLYLNYRLFSKYTLC